MKKILVRVAIGSVILIVIVVLAISLFLDGAVKRAVESVGSKMAQVDVKLDSVNLSLFSGSGTIKGLVIGNPPGYQTPHAIAVGHATLALKPASLLSKKIIIHKIEIGSPEITFEGGLTGNNLSKIRSNLEGNTSPSGVSTNQAAAKEETESKKMEVDDFLITNAKVDVAVSGLQPESVTIPQIHLTDLGTNADGITGADLAKKVLSAVEHEIAGTVASGAGNLGKAAGNLTKGLGKSGSNGLNQLGRGLGNLLKNKQ